MSNRTIYFAIIADRRTGSTMLRKTLNQHPQIHCSGEIFNSFTAVDGCKNNEVDYARTMGAFWEWRRSEHPDTASSIGTSIHRWQAGLFPGLWELTKGVHSRFICLYRENLLRHFLSEMIAMKTGKWSCDPTHVENLAKVYVDPIALDLFIQTRRREQAEDWRFQCRIEYPLERLVENWEVESTRIQHFLGVTPQPLTMATQKQETRLLSKAIDNYEEVAELVKQLGHPEWLDPGV